MTMRTASSPLRRTPSETTGDDASSYLQGANIDGAEYSTEESQRAEEALDEANATHSDETTGSNSDPARVAAKLSVVGEALASSREGDDDAGGIASSADSDLEDDDADAVRIVASARNDIDKLRKDLASKLPSPADKRQAMALLDQLEAISQRAETQVRNPERPISEVRRALERRVQLMREPAAKQPEEAAKDDKLKMQAVEAVLTALSKADSTLQACGSVPTNANTAALRQAIDNLEQQVNVLKSKTAPIPTDLAGQAGKELQLKLNELREVQQKLANYDSPHSVRKRLEERKLQVDAARAVFRSLKDDLPAEAKGKTKQQQDAFDCEAESLLSKLDDRSNHIDRLSTAISRGSRPAESEGTSRPYPALRTALAAGAVAAFNSITLNEEEPEDLLMASVVDAFLEKHPKADRRSGRELIALARNRVLSKERDWAIVQSEVLVPVSIPSSGEGSSQSPAGVAKVTTVTTPAGHVLGSPDITIVHKSSAINKDALNEYRVPDPLDKSKNRKITTGRNSHATTEVKHGVNVARTEMKAGGETLFGGTRHGTLSAYGLYPDTLAGKPDSVLKQIHADLTRTVKHATQVCTGSEYIRAAVADTPPFRETELDSLWARETGKLSVEQFITRARTDESFCALLRRKAALNRAREVFLTEALGNPELLQRIRQGEAIVFTSISLVTPDPFRNFLAKLFPKKYRMHDELSMRREEKQAWQDLQEAINEGQIEIDGKMVKGEIISFSTGVNRLALHGWGALGRALLSGWNQVQDDNLQAIEQMIGDPDKVASNSFGGALGREITRRQQQRQALQAEYDQIESALGQKKKNGTDRLERQKKILLQLKDMESKVAELKALGRQLAELWTSGEYRHAGAQPYKFAARIARLSFLLGAGTAFNCKSGKDRTAQLDLEVKLLSVQSEFRRSGSGHRTDGDATTAEEIPPSYGERSAEALYQMQAFVFQDETRTVMQRYNTGAEGSKLGYWQALYDSFIAPGTDAEFIGSEFRGRSAGVKS